MTNLNDVLSNYQQFWRFANNAWGPYLAEAAYDLRAYNGDTWTLAEKEYLAQQNRTILELNQIRPTINFFDGYFRDTMTSVSVQPVEGSDQKTADQLGDVLLFVYDKGNADHVISESVSHSFKVGLSLCGIYLDYANDPINGDIKFFWKAYNSFLLDPYFKDRSLSDCQQALLRDYVTKDEAKNLLPFIDPKEIDNLPVRTRDDKFLTLPERLKYYDNENLLTFDQYYVRTSREVEYMVDLESGMAREMPKDQESQDFIKSKIAYQPHLKVIRRSKPTIQLNIIVSDIVLYSGPDPMGLDDYPFVGMITYYDRDMDQSAIKLQGLTRGMRDAQREFNKRHSKFIDIQDKFLYAGFMYKPDYLVDQESIFQTGQGANIPLTKEATIGQDILPMPTPNLPQGILEYQKILDNLIPELAGVNQDMLGMSEGGNNLVSGALAQIRASNGLRSNRGVFDNMEYSQKILAERVIEAVQKNYGPLKVARILGEKPTDEFFSQQFDKYDAQIVQTVKSQNQRQQFYVDLLQARQLGIAIPDDLIIEAMPMQNKSELLDRIKDSQEQQAQQQQRIQELEEIQKKAINAQTIGNVALSVERIARAEADSGLAKERISELQQNAAQSVYDKARAIKELQGIDMDNLARAFALIQTLSQKQIVAGEMSSKQEEQDSLRTFGALNAALNAESQPQPQPNVSGGING